MNVVKGQALRLRSAVAHPQVRRRTRDGLRSAVRAQVRSMAFDVVVAVFVCTFDAWQLLDPSPGVTVGSGLMGAALLASVSLPLLWRRRRPVQVLAVVTIANVAWFMLPYVAAPPLEHFNAGFVAFLVSLYSAGLYSASRKTAVAAAVAAFAALLPAAALRDEQFRSNPRVFLMNASFVAIAFYVGYIGRVHRDYLAERAARVEQERTAETRRAVATERGRIARELHDVVAHSVGLMTVQAGAANLVAGDNPDAALSTLSAIERTGRQALAELRRLLGVLRTDGDDDGALSPQPELDRLDELVTKVREAGIEVKVTTDGDLGDLPTTLGLSAYRILQEALTNVIKHAGPHASAEVLIQRTRDHLVMAVSDDGQGSASPDARVPGGNGLIGMRERVALFGGRMTTGPRHDGGFVVRVEIPLDNGQR